MDILQILGKNNIVAAPMAGVTDLPFRKIIRNFHNGLSCAEMVSSQSLVRCKSKKLYEKQILKDDFPTSFQILGRNSEYMAQAAKILQDLGALYLDINMGCSVRKVLRQNEGACLIAEPVLALKIAENVVKSVEIPVTIKIRKSFRGTNSAEIIKNAHNVGIKAITIHGRSAEQLYSGTADWSYISAAKQISSIPVIGNGDIKSPDDAIKRLEESQANGVMIGRAMLGNPWILESSFNACKKLNFKTPENSEKLKTGALHISYSEDIDGENNCFKRIRKHLSWYIKGMPMASSFRDRMFHTKNLNEVKNLWSLFCRFIEETESLKEVPIGSLEKIYHKYII